MEPPTEPEISDIFGCLARFGRIEVELRNSGFAAKVLDAVSRETHSIDDTRATVLQHDILRDADFAQSIADLPQPRAHAFAEDVVHAAHTLRPRDERAAHSRGLARHNGRTVAFSVAEAFASYGAAGCR